MAMTACKECGTKISDKAKACPHCGAEVIRTRLATKIIAGLIVLTAVVMTVAPKTETEAPPREPPQRTGEQQAAINASEARHRLVVAAGRALKTSLHDPKSLEWDFIYTNSDASLICMRYRAKNAFGAMVINTLAITNAGAFETPEAWNTHCANKPLMDHTAARFAM